MRHCHPLSSRSQTHNENEGLVYDTLKTRNRRPRRARFRYYGLMSCTPSRSALMTGIYPINTGMQFGDIGADASYGLPLQFETLGDVMGDAGYETYFFGKWNLGLVTPQVITRRRHDTEVSSRLIS